MTTRILLLLLGKPMYLLVSIGFALLLILNIGDSRKADASDTAGIFFVESKDWANPITGELFNTPKEACDDYIKVEYPGKNFPTKLEPAGSGDINSKRCLYQDTGTWHFKGVVHRIGICLTSPDGLYSNLDASENFVGTPGDDFDEAQKKQKTNIKNQNIVTNGFLKSDDDDDPCSHLCPATQAIGGQAKNLCEVEIDHIVPKKSNKEPCGSNSYANARVTSHRLNNAKGNNPDFDAKTLPKITPSCPKVTSVTKPSTGKPPLGGN